LLAYPRVCEAQMKAPRSGLRRTPGGSGRKMVCYTTFDDPFRTLSSLSIGCSYSAVELRSKLVGNIHRPSQGIAEERYRFKMLSIRPHNLASPCTNHADANPANSKSERVFHSGPDPIRRRSTPGLEVAYLDQVPSYNGLSTTTPGHRCGE
jgi:hypothetical protein